MFPFIQEEHELIVVDPTSKATVTFNNWHLLTKDNMLGELHLELESNSNSS
ncbi:MAG: hypothetical protein ACJASQ_002701 [Crocinitomicaceae bacterium]|jgi:hypothetical protein